MIAEPKTQQSDFSQDEIAAREATIENPWKPPTWPFSSSMEKAIHDLERSGSQITRAEIVQQMVENEVLNRTYFAKADLVNQVTSRHKPLFELSKTTGANGGELLRNRFLCRGGGLLVCGPTGIGKSSLSMQLMMLWALGRPCFGIAPARPLKSLLIQAENDEGDLVEMRDGVANGLAISKEDRAAIGKRVSVSSEDSLTGQMFIDALGPLLERDKPDLVWIDPALAYLGGESNSQKDVGGFLRNGINPLIHKHNCAAVVIHHSNKPPSGQQKPNWTGGDFAYLGAGSAEWANWSRAILALRSVGSHSVFELMAAKRGGRLHWRDENGATVYSKPIAHHKTRGVVCWRVAGPDDMPSKGRPKACKESSLLALLPTAGLKAGDWETKSANELGVSKATFKRYRKSLEDSQLISKSQGGKWIPTNQNTKAQKSQKGSK